MKLFAKRKDGGPDSNVTGYWLIEWKEVFSIALLRFSAGSREAFHSHAFNAVSWILYGRIREWRIDGGSRTVEYGPSFKPIITTRDNLHRVYGLQKTTWALTFRGPWSKTWMEKRPTGDVTLTHGRKVVA